MKRRDFITLIGGAAAWPLAARAQQSERLRRIGVLTAMSETDPTLSPRMAAFQKGLQAMGWAEGRNVSIVYRHATGDLDRLKSAALELVAAAPELIVVWSNPAVIAMRAVDRSIPVVFVSVGDPVGSGFVESLGRPGGNMTGFTAFEPEMGGKWLEHLKEVAPALTRAMVLLHPDSLRTSSSTARPRQQARRSKSMSTQSTCVVPPTSSVRSARSQANPTPGSSCCRIRRAPVIAT